MTYQRIPQEEYDKALWQSRAQVNAIMNCFRCYGQNQDVDMATEELVKVIELFAMRVRGKEVPILVRSKPRRRPTE